MPTNRFRFRVGNAETNTNTIWAECLILDTEGRGDYRDSNLRAIQI